MIGDSDDGAGGDVVGGDDVGAIHPNVTFLKALRSAAGNSYDGHRGGGWF